MIAIDPVFGAAQRTAVWDPVVVIRHGFNSDHKPFIGLAGAIQAAFPNATVDNQSYAWRESVFYNGTKLAYEIWTNAAYAGRDLVMIGHSMGGLVCRMANAVLCDDLFRTAAPAMALNLGYAQADVGYFQTRKFPPAGPLHAVNGLVTLATPNSGAMLQGQVSGLASLVQGFLNVFAPTRVSSVADLTSSRAFELLETAATATPVLSISGSYFNRFTLGSGQLANWTGLAGINLDYPHDGIVEDRSVDLNESILANELTHRGAAPYLHLRAYEHCTNVTHTNIYNDHDVRKYVLEFLRRV